LRFVRQPEASQRHASEADAEFLQRGAASDRLGHVLGEFIELVVHTFPFLCFVCFSRAQSSSTEMDGDSMADVATSSQGCTER
jgi:hypothetical protein